MHRFPCIHAKEEAQRTSFASPLSSTLGFSRLLLLQVLLPPLLLLLLLLLLALALKREAKGDARHLSLADLTAMRFWFYIVPLK